MFHLVALLLALASAQDLPDAPDAHEHPHVHGGPALHVPAGETPTSPLVTGPSLEEVVARVLSHHPGLAEAGARVTASRARAAAASRLPEPQLQAELREVPLDRPFDPQRSRMAMVGLRQMLPAPGARAARARAAFDEAGTAKEELVSLRLELAAEARRAFAAFSHAAREEDIHLQHVDLSQRIVVLARGRFEAGRMSKRELLRTIYELSRLHADVVGVQAFGAAARAQLNGLMAREVGATLGQPRPVPLAEVPDLAPLREALRDRPDLVAAHWRVDRAEAALQVARREAAWPQVMVGLDYGYMFMDGTQVYSAMVGANLPWLWGPRRDAEAAAAADLEAARRAEEALHLRARTELEAAAAVLQAARDTFDVLDRDLEPQARRMAEEAQSEFVASQGEATSALEALHAWLTVRLQRSRALQALEEAAAELDRAAGLTLPQHGERP